MPVIGAVLHFEHADHPALQVLRDDPRVELGTPVGTRQPIVTSTTSRAEDKALWRTIETLPGVLHIELAFAEFSDLTNPETAPTGIEVTP